MHWVYAVKNDFTYKARLVCDGSRVDPRGLDTRATVIKSISVRLLDFIAHAWNKHIITGDIGNAFGSIWHKRKNLYSTWIQVWHSDRSYRNHCARYVWFNNLSQTILIQIRRSHFLNRVQIITLQSWCVDDPMSKWAWVQLYLHTRRWFQNSCRLSWDLSQRYC